MKVEYSFHSDGHVPGLEQLWEEQTDWGGAAVRELDAWFASAPSGVPRTVAARDVETGTLVASFRFMPTQVVAGGQRLRGVRPFGTIVSPAASVALQSNNPLRQPAMVMYRLAMRELRAEGTQVVHMTPDPRWMRLLRMLPFFQTGKFPLWSVPLTERRPEIPGEFVAEPLTAWTDEVDVLAEEAARQYGCMLLRDSRTLSWRCGVAAHAILTVRREGRLVGVVAGRAKGDRQWLICDMITADARQSLAATVTAAHQAAHDAATTAPPACPIRKVGILATPLMQPTLGSLGFAPDNYEFLMGIHVLDPMLASDTLAPARWYACATD